MCWCFQVDLMQLFQEELMKWTDGRKEVFFKLFTKCWELGLGAVMGLGTAFSSNQALLCALCTTH